jgi:tRNA-splicing ligase RtcB (3'-phosphate/5'-hydroxy nucleic acid ligase)
MIVRDLDPQIPIAYAPGNEDVNADSLQQLKNCVSVEDGAMGALMADHHRGYSCPIGGVVAYRNHVSPSCVGVDIACGNLAVRTDVPYNGVRKNIGVIMDDILKRVSFGVGRPGRYAPDHVVENCDVLHDIRNHDLPEIRALAPWATKQLGTIGGGNHYLDLFVDAEGSLWIGVHFGSRGFGHAIAQGFTNLIENQPFDARRKKENDMDVPHVIRVDTDLGQAYLKALDIAGAYAYAGRDHVVAEVMAILGCGVDVYIHNHHNFAWKEEHFGETWYVHRKGATPAFTNQAGFIGGSMGDQAAIVRGVDITPDSAASFRSTVHGAGRVMSRTRAKGKFHKKTGEMKVAPEIDWKAVQADMAAKGIVLRGAGPDEAPGVYKRITDVLDVHSGGIKVDCWLQPVAVAMDGHAPADD